MDDERKYRVVGVNILDDLRDKVLFSVELDKGQYVYVMVEDKCKTIRFLETNKGFICGSSNEEPHPSHSGCQFDEKKVRELVSCRYSSIQLGNVFEKGDRVRVVPTDKLLEEAQADTIGRTGIIEDVFIPVGISFCYKVVWDEPFFDRFGQHNTYSYYYNGWKALEFIV